MNINVHFLDKTVFFGAETAPDKEYDAIIVADESITRAKILKILETCNRLAVLSPHPQTVFAAFAREFVNVDAAGGVVVNPQGEVLMMLRRGRWDLPKGHIEPRELPRVCARREVAEETGISRTTVGAAVCSTYHTYELNGRWELKRTQWFAMKCDGREKPVPQHEEGIDRVQWIPRSMLGQRLAASFPTIREVMENYYKTRQ